jgi:heat shock protein HslJ
MRKLTFFVLALAATAIVAACSSSGSSAGASAATSGGGSGDLTGKTWMLTAITEKVPAFQGVVPAADQANYTIEFKSDGTFAAKADCNQVLGTYTTTSSGGLTIVLGPSTLVACPEGSLAPQYVAGLGNAASYAVANGQLTITLKDEGTLVFK